MTEQEFIERHRKVCQRSIRKVVNPKPAGEHKGRGTYLHRTTSKGSCGKRLYKKCLELGIDPSTILHYADLPQQQA